MKAIQEKYQELAVAALTLHEAWAFIEQTHCRILSTVIRQPTALGGEIYYAPSAFEVRSSIVDRTLGYLLRSFDDDQLAARIEACWRHIRKAVGKSKRTRNKVAHCMVVTTMQEDGPIVRLADEPTNPTGDFGNLEKQKRNRIPGRSASDIRQAAELAWRIAQSLAQLFNVIAFHVNGDRTSSLQTLQMLEAELNSRPLDQDNQTPPDTGHRPLPSPGSPPAEPPGG